MVAQTTAQLLRHARALVGVTLAEIADGLGLPVPLGGLRTKGWAGQVIERELGAETGGVRGPDFAALGLELKTVPVDDRLQPLESTAVCHIDPVGIVSEPWADSHVRRKLARVIFVALEIPGGKTPLAGHTVGDRRVSAVSVWSPDPQEEAILAADYDLVVREYFRPGRAAELTGHTGVALQVRPKGRNSRDLRAAVGPDGQPVMIGRSGFYLRPGFVGRILRASRS
jgi:DNA mismatch repair protein MutH